MSFGQSGEQVFEEIAEEVVCLFCSAESEVGVVEADGIEKLFAWLK